MPLGGATSLNHIMETERQFERSSPAEEIPSIYSDPATESEDLEISDDDDRNHKHRRREAEPHSVATDTGEQSTRRPYRKRKPLLDNASPSLDGNEYSKFVKRRTILTTTSGVPSDSGSRTRVGQAFRQELGPHFDGSMAGRPPSLRGRGRNAGFLNQQDSRLSSFDSQDFSSQLPSQGQPGHPSLFVGGCSSAASVQTASWGAYGFMHPMGMQGALPPTVSPLINMGVPRQRCRDFDERGFCLRGDMCPMEHGVNRIVVEDVQSLSQFNLPVSVASSQVAGQADTGSLSSGLPTICKSLQLSNEQCTANDSLMLDGVSYAIGASEADVYDPDQPLWNNDCPKASKDHSQVPVSNDGDESLWSANPSGQGSLMLSDGLQTVQRKRALSNSTGMESIDSSLWVGSRHAKKLDTVIKTNGNVAGLSQLKNNVEVNAEGGIANSYSATQGKHGSGKEMGSKISTIHSLTKPVSYFGRDSGRTTKRASHTLFIQGIPQKSNCKEALLSHFQKFGNVIDIYIPLNSEIAFVQFSKKEEAEAAIEAPDAVMGNRFIKLWWANRDRIHVEEEGSAYSKVSRPSGMLGSSVLSQSSSTGQIIVPSSSNTRMPSAGTLVPAMGPPKSLAITGPTTPRPVQKKLANLDILEEIRKKQEMLDKKRDELRRRLDKYVKQAVSVKKVEPSSEHTSKKHKGDNAGAVTPRHSELIMDGEDKAGEGSQNRKSISNVLSSASNGNSGILQTACIKDKSDQNEPIQNSSELDCHHNSFLIVPPIPSRFADAAAVRKHFSVYGDLDSVTFEDPGSNDDEVADPTIDSSVCVSFTTHSSAERAYTNGRCWEGQSLHCVWKTVSGGSSNNCHESENVETVPSAESGNSDVTGFENGETSQRSNSEIKTVPSATSSNSDVTTIGNGETSIDVVTNFTSSIMPKVLPWACCSTPNTTPSEDHPSVFDASMG